MTKKKSKPQEKRVQTLYVCSICGYIGEEKHCPACKGRGSGDIPTQKVV